MTLTGPVTETANWNPQPRPLFAPSLATLMTIGIAVSAALIIDIASIIIAIIIRRKNRPR